jgi:hypothetical protein
MRFTFGGQASGGSGATAHLAPGDSPGANYAVPEPGAWLLALLAALGVRRTEGVRHIFRRRQFLRCGALSD